MTFRQKLGHSEGTNHKYFWKKFLPGGNTGYTKAPEAAKWLESDRTAKEAVGTGYGVNKGEMEKTRTNSYQKIYFPVN